MGQHILIAGGGIGGLAAAVGLAGKGHRCTVLEKSRQLGEIGAGIQLGPNAFHAFDYLGVGDAARKMAVYIDALRLMDAVAGEEITRIPSTKNSAAALAIPMPSSTAANCTACFSTPAPPAIR